MERKIFVAFTVLAFGEVNAFTLDKTVMGADDIVLAQAGKDKGCTGAMCSVPVADSTTIVISGEGGWGDDKIQPNKPDPIEPVPIVTPPPTPPPVLPEPVICAVPPVPQWLIDARKKSHRDAKKAMREANHALLRANQAISDTEIAQNNAANEAEKAKEQKEILHQTITKRKSWDEITHSEIKSKEAVFSRTQHEQQLLDKSSLLYSTYESQKHSSEATATAAASASATAVAAANKREEEENLLI